MKKIIGACILILSCIVIAVKAQTEFPSFSKELLTEKWPAYWISVPEINQKEYGVYHFRKSFSVNTVPASFIVHVSGDNRYKLFVNEKLVSLGPAASDITHWNFETVDVAPYLKAGENIVAAVVWNYADARPFAHQSLQTGFILQGNGPVEQVVNTNKSWKALHNRSYTPVHTNLYTYFVVGPGEKIDFSQYPWGWESVGFNDEAWQQASEISPGTMWNLRIGNSDWTLTPRSIPQMELTLQRLMQVRKVEGATAPKGFLQTPVEFKVPAHTKAILILDQSYVTTAYPVFSVSGGKGSQVTLSYAESLFHKSEKGPNPVDKGNRNEVEGKVFFGYKDVFLPGGGDQHTITSLWWRTYRYIELMVETKDEPLVIQDIYGIYTGYPLKKTSTFQAPGRPDLEKILQIGWRTARLCAHETYIDCPYYEQLQYAGDVRLQLLITMFNSPDDRLVRNAIIQLKNSLSANGLTMSRHPSREDQFIPTFSLWWLGILHDYWMYRGDNEFIKSMLPVSRSIVSYFMEKQAANGSLRRFPEWSFTDWTTSKDWSQWGSIAPYTENGNSAPLDLQLLLAYQTLAPLEENIGMKAYAELYEAKMAQLKNTIRDLYWDSSRQLFSDTPQHTYYSQHSNLLAVLTGVIEGEQAHQLMEKVLSDKTLVQTSIFFKYYLHRAAAQAGMGDRYIDLLEEWRSQMSRGLTTWAETHEPSRSDCHAWGATPNIEFFRIVLGIDADAPGFSQVVIAPHLGSLKKVSGSIPHPKGEIKVSYTVNKKGKLTASIDLPEGVTGRFLWKGEERMLQGGSQMLNL